MENDVQLYDVIVIEKDTRKVTAVVGDRMHLYDGYHSAEQRKNTWMVRCSNAFIVQTVKTGTFKQGDYVPRDTEFVK